MSGEPESLRIAPEIRGAMLRRIHVQGFKSLLDVDVELAQLVLIFGPNAVGKSNFLEAIELLSRIVTSRTLAEAFDTPRGYPTESFSLPASGLPGLLEQSVARLALEGELAPVANLPLKYRVEVNTNPALGSLELADEYLVQLRARDRQPNGKARIQRDGDLLVIRRVREQGQPRHESLGGNHAIVSNLQYSGDKYPDFDRLRGEVAGWRVYYLDPRSAMRSPQPPRQVDDIGSRGEWLAPFLYRLKTSPEHSRWFQAIGRALSSTIPAVESLDVELDPQRGTLDIIIVQNGTPFSSRVVSEGTLRVLALCAIRANPWPANLVAFEEPENGVHPRRIETVVDLLTRVEHGQVIVTTHSPVVVSAVLRFQRKQPDRVRLLRCFQDGNQTRIEAFDAEPLFEDEEISRGLRDEGELLEAALRRGWLGG